MSLESDRWKLVQKLKITRLLSLPMRWRSSQRRRASKDNCTCTDPPHPVKSSRMVWCWYQDSRSAPESRLLVSRRWSVCERESRPAGSWRGWWIDDTSRPCCSECSRWTPPNSLEHRWSSLHWTWLQAWLRPEGWGCTPRREPGRLLLTWKINENNETNYFGLTDKGERGSEGKWQS